MHYSDLATLHFFWSSGVETGDAFGVPSNEPLLLQPEEQPDIVFSQRAAPTRCSR